MTFTSLLLWVPLAALVFAGTRLGSRLIEGHYSDTSEVAGVMLLGACALTPLALAWHLGAPHVALRALLVIAVVGGMFSTRRQV